MEEKTKYVVNMRHGVGLHSYTMLKHFDSLPELSSIDFGESGNSFTLWKEEYILHDGKEYRSDDGSKRIGGTYYHPDCKISTIEEIRKGIIPYPPIGRALLSNMEMNGWEKVVWSRWGNFPEPFEKEDKIIVI